MEYLNKTISFSSLIKRLISLVVGVLIVLGIHFAIHFFLFEETSFRISFFTWAILFLVSFNELFLKFDAIELKEDKLTLKRTLGRNLEIERSKILEISPVKTWIGKKNFHLNISYFDGRVKNVKLPIRDEFNINVLKKYTTKITSAV